MSDIAVSVQHITKRFGSDTVLKDVSMELEQGKIHGIIGRNGSGKTVLMKCICGFLRPTEGKAQVFGKTIGKDCDFAPNTGMLIETPGFLPHETGMNNLLWLAKLGKRASKERVKFLIEMVGLDPTLRKPVSQYSLGMRQRLGIAQALLDDPALLILDEPMNGWIRTAFRAFVIYCCHSRLRARQSYLPAILRRTLMSCVIRFVKWIRVCLRFISRVKGAQILLYSCFESKKREGYCQ